MQYLNDTAQLAIETKRIDRTPVTMVNSLFTISEKYTGIVGYWEDKTGKLYTDNIIIEQYTAIRTLEFNARIKRLFKDGENAVFFKDIYNLGIIRFPNGTWDILANRIEIIEYSQPSIDYIHEIVRQHGGCTVYELEGNVFLIEIYKN